MDEQLLAIFTEESHDLVEALEEGLITLETADDPEHVNAVFRAAHTMKGNAGIVGFDDIVELTHLMEWVLDEMRQGKRQPDADTVGVLLSAVDALKLLVDARVSGQRPEAPADVIAALTRLLDKDAAAEVIAEAEAAAQEEAPRPQTEGPAADGDEQVFQITMRFQPDLFNTGTDPLQLLLELEELGQIDHVVCHAEDLPEFGHLDPLNLHLWWEVWLSTPEPLGTIENVFIFVADENDIAVEQVGGLHAFSDEEPPEAEPPREPERRQAPPSRQPPPPKPPEPSQAPPPQPPAAQAPPPAPQAPPPARTQPAGSGAANGHHIMSAPTIRVETDKLDKLVNLVGELVIGVARVSQLAGEDSASELGSAVEALDHISRDLQEQVMRVRMIPVEGTFNRFRRVVRDLAGELGKKIELVMSGTETELDKNVIEQIGDPLKHLIRNSADHGLETPHDRLAAGKNETGTVWLRAYQQEGKIIIEVADDGHGIDRHKVLAGAVERGLAQQGQAYSDADVYAFMFQPGFSTAAQVTEVSGRGVGLDVVRQNIESLRGSVEVESDLGKGTVFRIKLPLTLAIIDGMTVKVGEEILTLPLLSILESIRPKASELRSVEEKGELIEVRGEYLPLVRLYDILDMPTERTDPTQALVVIIESVSRRFGILVDDILGEQQAVIKSLEHNYREVEGVAGATILGDGRVSLILDVHGLTRLALA